MAVPTSSEPSEPGARLGVSGDDGRSWEEEPGCVEGVGIGAISGENQEVSRALYYDKRHIRV
jgi:hypothetical protein